MGVERIGAITAELHRAWRARRRLPVALVRWGTTGRQQTLRGTLGDIAAKVEAAGFKAPAVAVFGDVVKLRDSLNWFETRPLFGKRIVVTRTRQQAGALERAAAGARRGCLRDADDPHRAAEGSAASLASSCATRTATTGSSSRARMASTAFFECSTRSTTTRARSAACGSRRSGRRRRRRCANSISRVDLQPEEFVAEAVVKAFQEGRLDREPDASCSRGRSRRATSCRRN